MGPLTIFRSPFFLRRRPVYEFHPRGFLLKPFKESFFPCMMLTGGGIVVAQESIPRGEPWSDSRRGC